MGLLAPNFSFIVDEDSRRYVEDAYQAVTAADAWALMAQDPGEGGFMMSNPNTYAVLHAHMTLLAEHSGASYGWTMRQIQFIAQHGLEAYRTR